MDARNYEEFSKNVKVEFGQNFAIMKKGIHLSLNGKHSDEIVEQIGTFLDNNNVAFVSFPVLNYNWNPDYIDRNSIYFWDANGSELLHVSRGIRCTSISRLWADSHIKTLHFEHYNKNIIYTLYNTI